MAKQNGVISGKEDPVILAIRGACKAAKQEWTPALAYLQSAYLMGCRQPAVSSLAGRHTAFQWANRVGQARACRMAKIEPTNPELLAYIAAVQDTHDPFCIKTTQPQSEGKTAAVRQYRVDSVSFNADVNPIKIPLVSDVAGSKTSLRNDCNIIRYIMLQFPYLLPNLGV